MEETLSLSDVKTGMISEDQRIQMRIGNNPRENNQSHGLFADRGRDDQQSSRGKIVGALNLVGPVLGGNQIHVATATITISQVIT